MTEQAGGTDFYGCHCRLRLFQPTDVPERVRQALARPVLNHCGPEFRTQLAHAEACRGILREWNQPPERLANWFLIPDE